MTLNSHWDYVCCQDEWYKENGSEGSLGSVPKEAEEDGARVTGLWTP